MQGVGEGPVKTAPSKSAKRQVAEAVAVFGAGIQNRLPPPLVLAPSEQSAFDSTGPSVHYGLAERGL